MQTVKMNELMKGQWNNNLPYLLKCLMTQT